MYKIVSHIIIAFSYTTNGEDKGAICKDFDTFRVTEKSTSLRQKGSEV